MPKLKDLTIDGKGHYGLNAPGIPWNAEARTYLRITDIREDGRLNKTDLKSVETEDDRFLLQQNDIVFARTGASAGRNYFFDGRDGDLVYAGYLIKFSLDPEKAEPEYVKYYCQSPAYRDWVSSHSTGSTRPNLNAVMFGDLEIPLPIRETQRQIAAVLGALDDKIETNDRIIKNLQEQIMAYFHKSFTYDNYEVSTMDKVFDVGIGKTPPRKESHWFSANPEDKVWLSISDMGRTQVFANSSTEFLAADAVEKFNMKIVPDYTVLLSFKLTIGRVAISDGELTTNEAIAHFKSPDRALTEYLYCYLRDFNFQDLGNTSSIATAVNSRIIKGMEFPIPPENQLKIFHDRVEAIFADIKQRVRENSILAQIRDTLLPRLISGEIDVSDVKVDEPADEAIDAVAGEI